MLIASATTVTVSEKLAMVSPTSAVRVRSLPVETVSSLS